jgi:hypothetical protein
MKRLIFILFLLPFFAFAQLSETNITTTLVGNALGNSSRDVGTLCTAVNINQWSKKKPVREHGSPNWWEATNPWLTNNAATGGTDKFSIQTYSNSLGGTINDLIGITEYQYNIVTSGWIYHKPDNIIKNGGDYGTAESGFRLGDFRGYLHRSISPLNLTDYPPINEINPPSQEISYSSNPSNTALGVTLSDFALNNYYFGAKVEWGHYDVSSNWVSDGAAYKTMATTVSTTPSGDLGFSYKLAPFNNTDATVKWLAFLSSVPIRDANPNYWVEEANLTTTHKNAVVYILPAADHTNQIAKGYFIREPQSIVPAAGTLSISNTIDQDFSMTITVTPEGIYTTTQDMSAAAEPYTLNDPADVHGTPWATIISSTAYNGNQGTFTLIVRVKSVNTSGSVREGWVHIYYRDAQGIEDDIDVYVKISQINQGS